MERAMNPLSMALSLIATSVIALALQLSLCLSLVAGFTDTGSLQRSRLPRDLLAKPPAASSAATWELSLEFPRNAAGERVSNEPVVKFPGGQEVLARIVPILEQERLRVEAAFGPGAMNETTVLLRADRDVPAGEVQDLIRKCQETGFSLFSLTATLPR